LWIVENELKQTIGWVSFQSFYGRPAYAATAEISIYLDPSQRGKGLGKEILTTSIQKAKAFGTKVLMAYIFTHNEPSIKLFHHFGFEDWGLLPNIAEMDGIERSVTIVGKRIE
jgi:L-amino acid N-acyltransferase YncA